jgi:hypothetical protein
LHAFWSFQFASSCIKTRDDNEGQERVPLPNSTINSGRDRHT